MTLIVHLSRMICHNADLSSRIRWASWLTSWRSCEKVGIQVENRHKTRVVIHAEQLVICTQVTAVEMMTNNGNCVHDFKIELKFLEHLWVIKKGRTQKWPQCFNLSKCMNVIAVYWNKDPWGTAQALRVSHTSACKIWDSFSFLTLKWRYVGSGYECGARRSL